MISSNRMQTMLLVLVVLTVSSIFVSASKTPQTARVDGKVTLKQADGTVTVNGASAISGATIFSDSTITTAAKSSAVVSLGKLGRVEVHENSTMKLSFTDSNFSISMLEAGRVRVSSHPGVNATTTTRDGLITATGKQRNEFTVDTSCGNTFVAVSKGTVELRAGDTVKQIAAGSQDTAGQARPGCTPRP